MNTPVSVVVARTVKAGCEAAFEAWLARAIAAARTFEGHLGADVIRPPPGQRRYVLLFRYDTLEHLLAWEASARRRELVHEAEPLTERVAVQRGSGMETWFTLPGGETLRPPPRWKMALVTWAVAFPLIQLLGMVLGPLLGGLPPLARTAAIGGSMVLTMTYAAMPMATRVLARFLYPDR